MEFESILVSKALPDREFRQNPVIDAHRYMTSLQPCAWSYLRRHPFFKSEVPTRVSIHAKASAARAASFKSAWGKYGAAEFRTRQISSSSFLDSFCILRRGDRKWEFFGILRWARQQVAADGSSPNDPPAAAMNRVQPTDSSCPRPAYRCVST